MNDAHVEALIYVVEHDESTDYSLDKAIETEHTTFRLKLEDQARHQSGISFPLTQPEVQFLEKAVAAMIIRAAMVAADPNQPMDTIDGNNLPNASP